MLVTIEESVKRSSLVAIVRLAGMSAPLEGSLIRDSAAGRRVTPSQNTPRSNVWLSLCHAKEISVNRYSLRYLNENAHVSSWIHYLKHPVPLVISGYLPERIGTRVFPRWPGGWRSCAHSDTLPFRGPRL